MNKSEKLDFYMKELSKVTDMEKEYDQELEKLKEQVRIIGSKRIDVLIEKEKLRQLIREF